jgi:hypothetical protein
MEPKYLIDSNAVIGFLARQIPAPGMAVLSTLIDQKPRISVITRNEKDFKNIAGLRMLNPWDSLATG